MVAGCDRGCYHFLRAVLKRSVAFDPELWKEADAAAREDRTSISALINVALSDLLVRRRGLLAMEAWQEEHGTFTDEEIAEADRRLAPALQPR